MLKTVEALYKGLGRAPIIGFSGAGGKTSSMILLAQELINMHKKVIITTTTKLYSTGYPDGFQIVSRETFHGEDLIQMDASVWLGAVDEVGKGIAPKIENIENLYKNTDIWKLIEIDGARGRSIKAPGCNEPVYPTHLDLVFGVIGAESMGAIADNSSVHRLDKFTEITGCEEGHCITPQVICNLINSPSGLFKGKAPNTMGIVLLCGTKIEDAHFVESVKKGSLFPVVELPFKENPDRKLRQIGIVLLAAGASKRMGKDKLLLPVDENGTPALIKTAQMLCSIPSSGVSVVYGSDEHAHLLANLPLRKLKNDKADNGISTSVKRAMEADWPEETIALLFMTGDMPQMSDEVIKDMMRQFLENDFNLMFPKVGQEVYGPGIVSLALRNAVETLSGDKGAKSLLSHPDTRAGYALFDNAELFADIDTPEAYEAFYQKLHRKKMQVQEGRP